MSDPMLTGQPVVRQAKDTKFWNTDPAVAKGAVTGSVTAITMILVLFGLMQEDQRQPIIHAVGEVAFWGMIALGFIVPVAQGAWTRISVWSPRTAAQVAINNVARGYQAAARNEAPPEPTLIPPP